MSFKKEFLENIIKLNTLIGEEKIITDTTNDKIKTYLNEVKILGTFSTDNWEIVWRKEIYKFGEYFKETNPEKVFIILEELIESTSEKSEIEVLEFIKSEIFLNFFTSEETIEYLERLTQEFRLNPEFKNSLAQQHKANDRKDLHCKLLRQALKLDKKNQDWLDAIYNAEYGIGKALISDKKHKEAGIYIQEIINSKFYEEYHSYEFQNFFIFLKQRNDDQLLIETKLNDISISSKTLIEDLFDKSRLNVIEILGFFTAIIAFIFGTVTISVSLELSSALVLMTSFGFVMIVFILTLSLVFVNSQSPLLTDKRLWTLVIVLLINISIIFLNPQLVKIIETLTK